MRFSGEFINLPDNVFVLLRDLIHEHTGIFYEDDKRDILADKLSPLILEQGFDSALDYYYLLKYDAEAEKEWRRLLNALTVPETYFWREIDQVKALTDHVVPEYFSANRQIPLRIWSAACCSGEEPISIAIALNEAGWFKRFPIEIYGSDISPQAIEKARLGLYRERSFRALPEYLRTKYFSQEGGLWRVSPEIHERIIWSTANLVSSDEVKFMASSSVIFCRNVFIYFSHNAIRKTLSFFAERMLPPGYLFVAASESLLRLTTDFELQEIGGAFTYIKRG
jgi:chemotaxis protein methyltransferase CheR